MTSIYLGQNTKSTTLSTTTSPVTPGTGAFSGIGVNPSNGTFANSSIIIEVKSSPSADFSISDQISCIDSITIIRYSGVPSDALVDWILPSDAIGTPSSIGSFGLQWALPGDYVIKVAATDNGCTSDTASKMVKIDPTIAKYG